MLDHGPLSAIHLILGLSHQGVPPQWQAKIHQAACQPPALLPYCRYANPLTFVTWGLIANQLGDRSDVVFVQTDGTPTNLAEYIETSLGFRHDFWGW